MFVNEMKTVGMLYEYYAFKYNNIGNRLVIVYILFDIESDEWRQSVCFIRNIMADEMIVITDRIQYITILSDNKCYDIIRSVPVIDVRMGRYDIFCIPSMVEKRRIKLLYFRWT